MGENTKLARVIIKKYRIGPMIVKNAEIAHSFVLIYQIGLSIFIPTHPLQGTRSACSVGPSWKNRAPLFNTDIGRPTPRAWNGVAENEQTRLAYIKAFSSIAPPGHQMAHPKAHAGTILRYVQPSHSGYIFGCVCAQLPSGLS